MQTTNPVLSEKVFQGIRPVSADDVMTIDGTVNKTLISLFLVMASAYWAYGNPAVTPFMLPAVILAFIVAMITFFKASLAPYTTPVYALLEGAALGAISFAFNAAYEGIVTQAIFLTFGVMLGLLVCYKTGIIKATPTFKKIVVAGTFGILLFYLVSMVAGFFGASLNFMTDSSPLSIGISVLICGFAAMNLVLDFDRIETLSQQHNAPRYMEWFCALGLLVTLVWLYLELLHLLAKIRGRD